MSHTWGALSSSALPSTTAIQFNGNNSGDTRSKNLYQKLARMHVTKRPKLCGLVGQLCLKVSCTRKVHGTELRSIQCKLLVQVS